MQIEGYKPKVKIPVFDKHNVLVQNFKCQICGDLMLRFGSFNPQFLEHKEMKVYGVFKGGKEGNLVFGEWETPRFGKIGLHIYKCVCDGCGTNNVFDIIFGYQKGKLRLPT